MKKAFTLIELLVVVLIIGILAAIALPQYQFAVKKARYTHLQTMCKSLADAAEVYYLAHGDYTTEIENLDVQLPDGYTDQGFEVELTKSYVVCKHNNRQGESDLARFFITFQHSQSQYAPSARYCYGETNFCKKMSVTGQIEEGTAAYRLP